MAAIAPSSFAQSPAMLNAAQAQGESQEQSVVKEQAREKRAALEAAGVDGADVDGLIRTLEDPAARDKLVSQLKALKAVEPTNAAAAEKPPGRIGGRIIESLSEKIDKVSVELVGGAELLLQAPRGLEWLER